MKRGCLHLYIPFRTQTLRSARSARFRSPQQQLVAFIRPRGLDLKRCRLFPRLSTGPNTVLLHADALDANMVRDTLNVILKFQEDIENVKGEVAAITAKVAK